MDDRFFEKDGKPQVQYFDDNWNSRLLEYLRYHLDSRVYYFGNNFKDHYELRSTFCTKMSRKFNSFILLVIVSLKLILRKGNSNSKVWNASYNLSQASGLLGNLEIGSPPWHIRLNSQPIFTLKMYFTYLKIQGFIDRGNSKFLQSKIFVESVAHFENMSKEFIVKNNVLGIILPHTIGFFEKLIVDVFRDLNRPSITLNHGLPYYWKNCDNLSDYIAVWGPAVKRNYILSGFSSNRILVTGHPRYTYNELPRLRFDLGNVLIVTKSINGIPYYDNYSLRDRSTCIVYLNMVRSVLSSFDIKSVRFRPHPSENGSWYMEHLCDDFFQLDSEPLEKSLSKTSLVIGPTSTVFIESILNGVNYLVFEPKLDNGNSFDNCPLVPPFDSSDNRVPCAHDIGSLKNFLINKTTVGVEVLKDYCAPRFDDQELLDVFKM